MAFRLEMVSFTALILIVGCLSGDEEVDYCCDYDPSNPVPSDWVVIDGGTFEMGCEDWDSSEMPIHDVTVSSFEMWRTEVTVVQYAQCVCAGACTTPNDEDDDPHWSMEESNWGHGERNDYPINFVDWYGSDQFCAWVGGRLPSEAQWEFAARSRGVHMTFPWGEAWPACDAAVMNDLNYDDQGCGTGLSWPVCGIPAGNTEQNLCDMSGNVWEWVLDEWHGGYIPAPIDGTAWGTASDGTGIIRGGGYATSDGEMLRTTVRMATDPSGSGSAMGFRCARQIH